MVKQYLRDRHVPFEEIDVSNDPEACERLLKLTGCLSIPVVHYGDSFVVGFSRRRLDELLKTLAVSVV